MTEKPSLTYALSRTQRHHVAVPIALIVLVVIPILNVGLAADRSSEALLVLLIWNVLTVLLSSVLASIRTTAAIVIVNVVTLLLLPALVPSVSLAHMTLPLIFNGVMSITILAFALHRNLLERDRLLEVREANARLQTELNERKHAEQIVAHSATHDALTDLPNRVLFMDHLEHMMERARRHGNTADAVLSEDAMQRAAVPGVIRVAAAPSPRAQRQGSGENSTGRLGTDLHSAAGGRTKHEAGIHGRIIATSLPSY